MNVLGLSAFYHESACCLLRDGVLVAAAAEERFTRVKHDPRLPAHAFRFCLDAADLSITDLDAVAYYERPTRKLERQLWAASTASARRTGDGLPWLDPRAPERQIRERLGWEGPILTFPHHLSHAASAYCFSGFDDAAVLTVDGVGEWATTAYGAGRGDEIELFEEVRFPHSLGLLYSTLTAYLGFRVNGGEYKVMGLAPYGKPRHAEAIGSLIVRSEGADYELDLAAFDFVGGESMFSDELVRRLGRPPREPESEIEPFHCDVAASLQRLLEELLLDKVRYLAGKVDSPRLAMAGGVALNAVAVGRIRREGPFEELFVQPAAGDSGGSLGAAALAHRQLTGRAPLGRRLADVFLGPRWGAEAIGSLLAATGLAAEDRRGDETALLAAVAERLAAGEVVGWFHGRMELGPRALGARSLLADPRRPDIRERLNRAVKKREAFRPFAPSVLSERAAEHFALGTGRPSRLASFMLETCAVRSPLALPGITHVDGSARPQTVDRSTAPRFARLLDAFAERTGCPLLVNTSFNLRGEPIVCSPIDALMTFGRSAIDALVLEDFVIDRSRLPAGWVERVAAWKPVARPSRAAVHETLYTFV